MQAGIHNTIDDPTTSQPTNTTTNPDTNLLFESLDPPLRPGRPDPTLPNSLEIYEEHKRTAQEYWEVSLNRKKKHSNRIYNLFSLRYKNN